MADNSTLPATGDVVRDKDRSGVKTQIVGLDTTPGASAESLLTETKPLPVSLAISRWPTYIALVPNQVLVAAAVTPHWDLFNADAAKNVRVLSVRQVPDVITAVTGVSITWKLERTSAIGTGGASITPLQVDKINDAALDTDITMRSKPTGGATAGDLLGTWVQSSEETNALNIQMAALGGFELVPAPLVNGKGILLGPSTGLRVSQNTSSSAGNYSWWVVFTIEG